MNAIDQEKYIIETIRNSRIEASLSHEKLGKLAGCTKGTIYRIEAGQFLPNLGVLLRICEALKIKIELLQL